MRLTSTRRAAAISQGAPRAAALVGLARTLKKQGLTGPALDAYRALASLGAVSVAGWPAELEAHRQRRKLYEGIGDHQSGLAESELIRTALAQCRFQIDKVTFDSYAAELPTPPNVDPVGLRLAEAAAGLWTTFDGQSSGRMSFSSAGGAVTAAWKRTDDRTAVILSPTTALMASAQPVANDLRVAVVLEGDTGQRVAGTMAPGAQTVARTTRESSLPWAVRVAATDADALQKAGRARDRILGAAFGLMVLIIGASAYVVSRSLMRELEVARLQSDFVAAVSHEFRTPLTAMRHMTEVLEEDSADAAQRPRYFRALAKETRRLHNLVESLLDFRKMEEGRPDFQAVDLDPNALVRELVGQLREGLPERRRIILQSSAASLFVQGDWDALALALRNVIDNALKYSPVDTPVTVSVERRGGDIAISVDDHGPGIPASEQRAVFRKFVRGASTKALNVKGTGIGLTMADRIVRTHAGRLELESDGRSGCRFTILLPLRNIAAGTAEAASSANT